MGEPNLSRDEMMEIEYLEGWELVEGTEESDQQRWVNLVTNVYAHGGRFFAVTIPVNMGDGESADAYDPEMVEVFPVEVLVTQYVTERPLS